MQLATRGRQARKICGLRLFHPDPWPTRSQKPGEAGSTAGWGNLGGHWRWRLEEVWSATALPRAERDWRLEIGRGGAGLTSPCPRPGPLPPAACSATILHPAVARWHSTCSENIEDGDLCHGRDGMLHCACYKRRHVWGRCCCWQECAAGGKMVCVVGHGHAR